MKTDCTTCDHFGTDDLFSEPCRYQLWNDDNGQCSMFRPQASMVMDARKLIKEGTK